MARSPRIIDSSRPKAKAYHTAIDGRRSSHRFPILRQKASSRNGVDELDASLGRQRFSQVRIWNARTQISHVLGQTTRFSIDRGWTSFGAVIRVLYLLIRRRSTIDGQTSHFDTRFVSVVVETQSAIAIS